MLLSRFTAVVFRPVGTDLFEVVKRGQALGRVKFNRDVIPNSWDAYDLTGFRISRFHADADEAAESVAHAFGFSLTAVDRTILGSRIADPETKLITGSVYPPALVSA